MLSVVQPLYPWGVKLLTEEIFIIGRPFGEFKNTGNAALNGQIDKEISIVKQIKIQGKDVSVPEHLSRKP